MDTRMFCVLRWYFRATVVSNKAQQRNFLKPGRHCTSSAWFDPDSAVAAELFPESGQIFVSSAVLWCAVWLIASPIYNWVTNCVFLKCQKFDLALLQFQTSHEPVSWSLKAAHCQRGIHRLWPLRVDDSKVQCDLTLFKSYSVFFSLASEIWAAYVEQWELLHLEMDLWFSSESEWWGTLWLQLLMRFLSSPAAI